MRQLSFEFDCVELVLDLPDSLMQKLEFVAKKKKQTVEFFVLDSVLGVLSLTPSQIERFLFHDFP